jgi:hypothetical protein
MKLTRALITQVTGLNDDEQIDQFLGYCNMSNEFIANSTRYDIMVALDRCYDQYAKDRNLPPNDSLMNRNLEQK